MAQLTGIQVIKRFFEADGGRKVETGEFKALSTDERRELATLSAAAIGLRQTKNDKGEIAYEE